MLVNQQHKMRSIIYMGNQHVMQFFHILEDQGPQGYKQEKYFLLLNLLAYSQNFVHSFSILEECHFSNPESNIPTKPQKVLPLNFMSKFT